MWIVVAGLILSLRTTALMLLRYHRNVCDAGYCRVSGRAPPPASQPRRGAPPASHAHAARGPPSPARPARRVRVLILSVGSSRGGAGGVQCDTDILGALRINTNGTDSPERRLSLGLALFSFSDVATVDSRRPRATRYTVL
jgi:hypothetical protein